MAEGVFNYVTSGQLWEHLTTLGGMILTTIRDAIVGYATIGMWLVNNVLVPMAEGVATYVTSGQLWADLETLGRKILETIGDAIGVAADIIDWFVENVFGPMVSGVADYILNGGLWATLGELGGKVLEAIASGVGDVVSWIGNLLLGPIQSAVDTAKKLIGSVLGTGGLPTNAQEQLDAGTAQTIHLTGDYVPGLPVLFGPSPQAAVPIGLAAGQGGGQDAGGPGKAGMQYWQGPGQYGREAFIPGDDGHFYPDFMRNLERMAGMVMNNMTQGSMGSGGMAGAGAGGPVTIQVNVTPEVLRNEPAIERNAERFGEAIERKLFGQGARSRS
jgi:hypothetical protein